MMITCLMIGKDRHITKIKVDSKKANFTYNKGLYTIPKEAVNLTEGDKKEPYPELIYIESVALPVNHSAGSVSGFLTETVVANALKQVSRPKSEFLSVIYDYMRNPPKLFMLLFIVIIVAALLGSVLFP